MSHTLERSISIELSDGSTVSFTKYEELQEWIDQQLEFFARISAIHAETLFNGVILNEQIRWLQEGKSFVQQALSWNKQQNVSQEIGLLDRVAELFRQLEKKPTSGLVHASTADAVRVSELFEKNPDAAILAAHKLFNSRPTLREPARWMDAFDAYIALREDDFDAAAKLEHQKKQLSALKQRWTRSLDDQEKSLSAVRKKDAEASDRLKQMAINRIKNHTKINVRHAKEMAALRKAFSTEMTLRASEKFWSGKRKENRNRARTAFERLCITGLIGGIALTFIFWFLFTAIEVNEKLVVGQTLIFALPTLAYVWLLRIFASEYKQNQKMADDAEERVAMIYTFKALEHEGRVGDEERLIILNSLFRPHDTAADESIPLPAWESLVKKIQGRT